MPVCSPLCTNQVWSDDAVGGGSSQPQGQGYGPYNIYHFTNRVGSKFGMTHVYSEFHNLAYL